MLERWGLTTMKPFDQASVKKKERFPIEDIIETTSASASATESNTTGTANAPLLAVA